MGQLIRVIGCVLGLLDLELERLDRDVKGRTAEDKEIIEKFVRAAREN
jgi:hypothetical protein